MKKVISCCALTLALATSAWAAGKSDVADAAMKGDKAAVRALIAQKADVNAPQADGATAIQWAAYKSDVEMADMLIRLAPTSKRPTAKERPPCGSPPSTVTRPCSRV